MIRFGILGCGKITERFLKGCKLCDEVVVSAAASRDLHKAQEYCASHHIPYAYGSYEALCADNTVDAVYIATPPFAHYELVKMALNHGKHVLCEKPFVASEQEVEELFDLARNQGVMLMEAMKAVFTPTTKQVKAWLAQGKIGRLRYAEASYCYLSPFDHDHWVFDAKRMGGGILDVGVYAIAYLNELISKDIQESVAMSTIGETGADEFMQILIKYENGVQASVRGALNVKTKNIAYFYGSEGYIEVEDFWKTTKAKLIRYDGEIENFDGAFESEFYFQIDHFVQCIKKGTVQSPVMGERASKAVIRLINRHL